MGLLLGAMLTGRHKSMKKPMFCQKEEIRDQSAQLFVELCQK
jgi:hypothetical protein